MFSANSAPRNICMVLFPGFQLLDAAGPISVFEMPARMVQPVPYRMVVVSKPGGPVRSSSGVEMMSLPLSAAVHTDTLIVPGGEGTREAVADTGLLGFIRDQSAGARRTCSVCSGAFLLAEAGLLDGRRATTHWRRSQSLAQRYPNVQVEPDRIYVRDGNIWSSAGITAGIDLSLALVADDLGDDVSRRAARELVVHHRRHGGQSQFSVMQDVRQETGRFAELLEWVRENLAEDLSIEALAGKSGMSDRNFARCFKAETGLTPARFVEQVRLEAARICVESGSDSMEEIARTTGFGDTERMRLSFLRAFGQPPMAFRRLVRDRTGP